MAGGRGNVCQGGVDSTGMRGRGHVLQVGMHGRGACMQVVCVAGGASVAGGMCCRWACMAGGGHACRWCVWQEGQAWQRACVAGETAIAADGMHPTGIYSCFVLGPLYETELRFFQISPLIYCNALK